MISTVDAISILIKYKEERLDQNKNKKKYGKKENEMKDERCFLSTRWSAYAVSFDQPQTKK